MSQTLSFRTILRGFAISLLIMTGMRSAMACVPTPTPTPTPLYSSTKGPVDGWSRPNAPTALTATPDPASPATTINLSWTDNSNKESAYRVERSTDHGATWTVLSPILGANATTFTDNTLSSGTTGQYRVIATIRGGSESLPATVTRAC